MEIKLIYTDMNRCATGLEAKRKWTYPSITPPGKRIELYKVKDDAE